MLTNSGRPIPITGNGAFVSPDAFPSGTFYNVSVASQPVNPVQVCNVANASGAIAGSNVSNLIVTCSSPAGNVVVRVSGVRGTLVLQNNGGNDLSFSGTDLFPVSDAKAFPTFLPEGTAYAVTVLSQPSTANPPQDCRLTSSGSGIIPPGGRPDLVTITCSWTTQFGTPKLDYGVGVALDGTGNLYVAGNTEGSLFGTNAGGPDVFIRKYDAQRQVVWTAQFGSDKIDQANGLAIDAAGNVYVAGFTFGNLAGSSGNVDAFVAKYDSNGQQVWIRQFGTAFQDSASAIATDAIGNVYVTGRTFDALEGQPHSGGADIFLVKLNPNDGTTVWTRQAGSTGNDAGNAVATDANGDVYVAGCSEGNLNGQTSASPGLCDVVVLKYNGNGALLWTRLLGTSQHDQALGVAAFRFDVGLNPAGVYVVGETLGGLDGNSHIGGGFLNTDAFIVKYDADGNKEWTRQFGAIFQGLDLVDVARAVVANTGGAYVTGDTSGTLDIPDQLGPNRFIVSYGSDGVLLCTGHWNGVGTLSAGIVQDSGQDLFIAGSTSVGLDGNPSTPDGDAYVIRYTNNCSKQ